MIWNVKTFLVTSCLAKANTFHKWLQKIINNFKYLNQYYSDVRLKSPQNITITILTRGKMISTKGRMNPKDFFDGFAQTHQRTLQTCCKGCYFYSWQDEYPGFNFDLCFFGKSLNPEKYVNSGFNDLSK